MFHFLYDGILYLPERVSLGAYRSRLLGGLSGRVLDVGAGTGVNLQHYPEAAELTLLEPHPGFAARLEGRGHPVVQAFAEEVELEPESFDAVVCTLVLCSVRSPIEALERLRGLLKPGGELIFLEHVASDRPGRRWLQGALEPLWKCAAGNCHLTRDAAADIQAAGFELIEHERGRMMPAPGFVGELALGRARPV